MKFLRDIPDDTPENTVKNILLIIEEEADRLEAKVDSETEQERMAVNVTVDVSLQNKSFRLYLSYIESHNLKAVLGSIGNGFISAEEERWDLELLPKDIRLAPVPPFRWGLYPFGSGRLNNPPTHILDGTLLRRLLTHALSSQPHS